QVRQTMARQAKSGVAAQAPPQMQTMMKITPLFNLMTIAFPSGIGLYWVARNVWTIGQQHFVLAKYYEDHAPGNAKGGGSKAGPADDARASDKALPEGDASPPASGNGAANGKTAKSSGNGAASGKANANGSAASNGRPNPSTSKKKQQRRRR